MARTHEIELNGKNCTMKLNNLALANAEEFLGQSIYEVLESKMGVRATHVLAWMAMKSYERKLKLPDVYERVEQAMEEDPKAYIRLQEVVLQMALEAIGATADADEDEDQGEHPGNV